MVSQLSLAHTNKIKENGVFGNATSKNELRRCPFRVRTKKTQ